jgi:hypothetical protein
MARSIIVRVENLRPHHIDAIRFDLIGRVSRVEFTGRGYTLHTAVGHMHVPVGFELHYPHPHARRILHAVEEAS